jgi:hypothetical protein
MRFVAMLLAAMLAGPSFATQYKLVPVDLGNGYVLSGSVETDGSVGYLAPQNFTKWRVVVVQTTDTVFNEANSSAAQVSQVFSDGRKLFVPTSPDGSTDGGVLAFYSGAPRGGIPSGAVVADFSMNSQNIVGPGGMGGWQTPVALNLVSLGQPDATVYSAAVAVRGQPNVFRIAHVTVNTAPTVMRLLGTITTDGTVGPLSPASFKSWNLVGREQDIQAYTEKNSQIISASQVYADARALRVDNPNGLFQVGIPSLNPYISPTIVTIADFSDPSVVNGQASYYYGAQGLVATKTPLGATGRRYVAGRI